jgi:hypothetical protein
LTSFEFRFFNLFQTELNHVHCATGPRVNTASRSHARSTPRASRHPPLSPPLCPTRRLTPCPPSAVSCRPPFKRVLPPASCFSSHSNATLTVPSLTSASSRRTAPEDAATLPEPPSNGTLPRRLLSATPPPPDLLGEPRLRSPCPAQPPHSSGARAKHLAVPHPPVSPLPTRRPGHSRRGPSAQPGWASFTVHHRPPYRVSGPFLPARRRTWADLRPNTMLRF